jgi:zeta toxin family protein
MEQNLEYAQNRVEEFISELIHDSVPSEEPDAVFMAGIPGVGKTEVALGLANRYKNHIVIDADAFRIQFPRYDGSNSSQNQKASVWLVDQSFKFVVDKGYSLLYPNQKYRQKGFHQDHMHPYTSFEESKIKKLVLPDGNVIDNPTKEDWRRRRSTLANLQLLEGRENEKKNATPLVDWLKVQANIENVKYLSSDVSYEISSFEEFMEKRQKLMSEKLKEILL